MERRHEFKLQTFFKIPLGINLSGNISYLTGYPYSRQVNPRDLGVEAVRWSTWVFAEPRGSYNLDNLFLVDLRLEKRFKLGETLALNVFCDVFNLLNGNAATSIQADDASWTTFQEVFALQFPRYFRFGTRIEF
jgi:hypothetical protein